jgi:alanine racemase
VNDLLSAANAAPPAELHIDLDALVANYRALRELARPARVSAVVKANAYGLGVGPVAAALAKAGCDTFFVSSLAEGLELRALQPDVRVLVLEGAGGAIDACRAARLVPVLNTIAEVREWVARAPREAAVVQLETGMNRAGLDATDVAELASDTALLSRLRLDLLMTHLACADEPGHPLNRLQIDRFHALRALLPPVPTSIGNSAGTWLGPDYRGDLVRPGLALYGGRPMASGPNPMRPVVRLSARVLQLRTLGEMAGVGYGASARVAPATRIATVGAGYADGYPRVLGNRGYAIAGGIRVPVVGRVSMDLTTLDVSALAPEAIEVGDCVDLLGGDVPLEDAAELAGTVSYELLTRLSTRLVRRYRGGAD